MNAALFLRGQAAGYRHLASCWRTVCELTKAALCELRAERLEAAADVLEGAL